MKSILKRALLLTVLLFSLCNVHCKEIDILANKAAKGDSTSLTELETLSPTNAEAAKTVGVLYLKGMGVKKNTIKALSFLEIASELGDKASTVFLYKFYSNSKSEYKDPIKAQKYREALLSKNSQSPAESLPPTPDTYKSSIKWKPFVEPNTPPLVLGSGFAINPNGEFVTNFHVIDSCETVVVTYNSTKGYGKVISTSQKDDLAVIKVDGNSPYFLKIKNRDVKIGEKVKAGGYPARPSGNPIDIFKFSEGIVSSIFLKENLFQFSASISSGNSGGPVIDETGALIGIAVAVNPPGKRTDGGVTGSDFNYAINQTALKNLLQRDGIAFQQSVIDKTYKETDLAVHLLKSSANIKCF
jgi:S1-C subfamily serine protease